MILENARPQDLLLWQRVNKTWQAAIQRSSRLQEKLFFKVKICKNENEEKRAVLNPFMDLFLAQSSPSGYWDWIPGDAFCGKASYRKASWRKMLITNPAITELEVFVCESLATSEPSASPWWISCESGITIGQLAKDQELGSNESICMLGLVIHLKGQCQSSS